MKKKAVLTFHPLAMARSLEAQNEAVGLFFAKCAVPPAILDRMGPEQLRAHCQMISDEAERVRRVLWPQDNDA